MTYIWNVKLYVLFSFSVQILKNLCWFFWGGGGYFIPFFLGSNSSNYWLNVLWTPYMIVFWNQGIYLVENGM